MNNYELLSVINKDLIDKCFNYMYTSMLSNPKNFLIINVANTKEIFLYELYYTIIQLKYINRVDK